MKSYTYLILLLTFMFAACRPNVITPKPKGYFKLELPEKHEYQQFSDTNFPFSFEFPTYGKITQDTNLVLQEQATGWLNVAFKDYGATIYLSYKPISESYPFERLVAESYTLSYKHDKKADYIKTSEVVTPNQLTGVYYQVGGNAASGHQFFITDSTKNFIRGSLYFETVPNADSLKPATEFFKEDMIHLINTLQFK